MKDHGIHTTKTDYWIHLHPIDPRGASFVYWYRVAAMRAHIALNKLPVVLAMSKDPAKTVSGAGYVISKETFFIREEKVKERYCAGFDWVRATDRERGMRGQMIVEALLDHGVIQLNRQISISARSIQEEFDGIDGHVCWSKKMKFQTKTETVQSNNLFVQAREGRHQPNYTAAGIERPSDLLPLFNDRGSDQ
jgi:hypothetical protein